MLLMVAVVVATAAAVQLLSKPYDLHDADHLFQQFLQKYGKVYNSEEYLTRLDIFKQNLKEINERNARHPQTEYGITRFTDLTPEERPHCLGLDRSDGSIEALATKLVYPEQMITAPDQFDWRDRGVVTHVKNQGSCGSCYIFSATGAIEGQYAIKHNKSVALSEQQSVDCLTPWVWNMNCDGGFPHNVMIQYEHHGWLYSVGLFPEKIYPYTGNQSECQEQSLWEKRIPKVTNVTSVRVRIMDEESLKQFLYETGPLSIMLDFEDFWEFKKGIARPINCKPWSFPNHAVLLVGYGKENGTDYWIIKNSFGAEWGEKGYMRLVRGERACGIGRYVAICTVP